MDYPNSKHIGKYIMNTAAITHAFAQPSFRLTDSLERDLLLNAYEQQANARPLHAVAVAVRAFGRAFNALFSFMEEVNETMSRAQRANTRFSGSMW
jgi:hypothetical protein